MRELAPAPMGKRYEHDCKKCVYLGSTLACGRAADLYFCSREHETTVLARYSSDGPDYVSGLVFSYGMHADVTLARILAEQQGLLPPS